MGQAKSPATECDIEIMS